MLKRVFVWTGPVYMWRQLIHGSPEPASWNWSMKCAYFTNSAFSAILNEPVRVRGDRRVVDHPLLPGASGGAARLDAPHVGEDGAALPPFVIAGGIVGWVPTITRVVKARSAGQPAVPGQVIVRTTCWASGMLPTAL